MHICVHSQTRDDGSRFQRSTATSHVILFHGFEVISLNIDIPRKMLRLGVAWMGNYVQDSLFVVSALLNRVSE